jgi:hypothetical protein
MRQGRIFVGLLIASALLSACHKRRASDAVTSTSNSAAPQTDSTAAGPAEVSAGPPAALAALKIQNADFRTLTLRGTARIEPAPSSGPSRFSYRINVERGLRIWASASYIIEGARVLATPTSCEVMLRLQQQVYTDGYKLVSNKLGFTVDYALLEDVLLGNLSLTNPYYARHLVTQPKLQPGWMPGTPSVALTDRSQVLGYFFDALNTRPNQIVVVDSSMGPSSTLVYQRWQTVESQLLPFLLDVTVQRPNVSRIVLEHREVVLNPSELTFSFVVPSGYERIN